MGVIGYLIGKTLVATATATMLVTGIIIMPANPAIGVILIEGAEAGAAILASPVDPVSTTTAILTTGI